MRIRISIAIAFVLLGMGFLLVVTELNFGVLFDAWSIVIAIILPVIFMGIIQGFKAYGSSYGAILDPTADIRALKKSETFLNSLSASLICFAALGVTIGLIAMLPMLEDKSKIGPNMAICMLSLFYAVFLNLVLVIPWREMARKRIAEMEAK